MKRILFFPVILAVICQCRNTAGYPEPPPPKKVTTFVTYAYEQGDEPIQVPVPSGSFNTPELSSDEPGLSAVSAEIENFNRGIQQPDLARDLQPPREVPQFNVPLRGPIPIPIEQTPPSAPAASSPVNLEEINIINENDELKENQVVETPTSKIFPAKTQSFQIIKAPMIQEHSVTSDGDFMKALAHAFGVTNRFVLKAQLERGLKAPEAITTAFPPIPIQQTVELQQEVPPITENSFAQQQQQIERQKQSLQAALIQSLQRLSTPDALVQMAQAQQSRENGVYQHIFSHAVPNSPEVATESAQSQVPPPPPQFQYTFHVADGERKELAGADAAPKQVLIQEEGKVGHGQLELGLYNTEVLAPVTQQVEQPLPQQLPQQHQQYHSAVAPPPLIRKFKPISLARQVIETSTVQAPAPAAEAPAPVITPIKFSDSTSVSKTTFTRVRPQVLLYRDQNGNIQQTTPSQLQENQLQQHIQEHTANQQQIQANPANQQYIQENPGNQQYVLENPGNQQFVQENPGNQQFVQENPGNQQYTLENPGNQQYIQQNPVNQQYTQDNGEYIQKNAAQEARTQQVYSPVNALSGESQKQFPGQQQRFVYRYLTNGGESNEQLSGEVPESSSEAQFEDVEGKYAVFEPQKVIQNVNAAGQPLGVVVNGNQFRRRRPGGRRLKVRRKKVKVRRLAPPTPISLIGN